jgi:hypothetical protein
LESKVQRNIVIPGGIGHLSRASTQAGFVKRKHFVRTARGSNSERLLERRQFRRYAVSFPCTVKSQPRGKRQSSFELETETMDMSRGGFFFLAPLGEQNLPSKIECLVRLPIKTPGGQAVAIQCRGKVVRMTAEESGRIGVAASIEQFEFMHLT